jgi:hypothetical protein
MADVKDPQKLVDDIARQENEEDLAMIKKYLTDPVKKAGRRLYENVMGTPEQNKAAQDRMDKAKGKKAGGIIRSSASKRADGCAIKGKTKGRMV